MMKRVVPSNVEIVQYLFDADVVILLTVLFVLISPNIKFKQFVDSTLKRRLMRLPGPTVTPLLAH